jgi:hypothetical protein
MTGFRGEQIVQWKSLAAGHEMKDENQVVVDKTS